MIGHHHFYKGLLLLVMQLSVFTQLVGSRTSLQYTFLLVFLFIAYGLHFYFQEYHSRRSFLRAYENQKKLQAFNILFDQLNTSVCVFNFDYATEHMLLTMANVSIQHNFRFDSPEQFEQILKKIHITHHLSPAEPARVGGNKSPVVRARPDPNADVNMSSKSVDENIYHMPEQKTVFAYIRN